MTRSSKQIDNSYHATEAQQRYGKKRHHGEVAKDHTEPPLCTEEALAALPTLPQQQLHILTGRALRQTKPLETRHKPMDQKKSERLEELPTHQ
jgi:hypothetical protein